MPGPSSRRAPAAPEPSQPLQLGLQKPHATVVVGGFYGDEGKGKIIDALAQTGAFKTIARGGVGPNAGHTIVTEAGEKIGLRMLPSAVLAAQSQGARLLIGAGVYVDPQVLLGEMTKLHLGPEQVGVDRRCGVITEEHKAAERNDAHLAQTIGSTKSGCGAAAVDRILRRAPLGRDIPELAPYLCEVGEELHAEMGAGHRVLLEGTQAFALSNVHGDYPYATSKDTSASQVLADVGAGPTAAERVVAVFKAYVTRVGEGTLNGQLPDAEAAARGMQEFGTVTGRARRAAPFDFDLAKKSCNFNGATDIALTKLDILYPEDTGKQHFDDLSLPARHFINTIEGATGRPVTLIGTGPRASDTIMRAPYWHNLRGESNLRAA